MKLDVRLSGLQPGEEVPKLALYLVDSSGGIKSKLGAVEGGKVEVSPELQKQERGVVALGPDVDDVGQLEPDSLLHLRLSDRLSEWQEKNVFAIPDQFWKRWRRFQTCVSGRVRKCFPYYSGLAELKATALGRLYPPFGRRCLPVCNGIVEVWERTCCCQPPLILDLQSIIARLKELIVREPVKFPPPIPPHGPGPDPGPVDRIAEGKVDLALANGVGPLDFVPNTELQTDLRSLQTLPGEAALQYFHEKPSLWPLWCRCSSQRLGQTVLNPDGTFTFCFFNFPPRIFCRHSFFYKVKQWQNGQWVYIYDGQTAHQYFKASSFATLSTFRGLTCGQPPPPNGTDFATLQAVGGTAAYELTSHYGGENFAEIDLTQIGEYTLLPPPPNGGLVGTNDAPWAKTLSFLLFFHPDLKGMGAQFYRMSVVAADSNGAPVSGATPQPIQNSVGWQKFVLVGANWEVESQGLGPTSRASGGKTINGLFQIPYNSDAFWLGGQYHQTLDTTQYADGRYLIILELFDNNGNRLVPQGAPLSGTDVATPFTFLRLISASGPGSTAKVPFAALTHLFWFDNRPCYGAIEDLDKDGVANTEECQFLRGQEDSVFQVGYRAYHTTIATPPPRTFMQSYQLTWQKGLNGPSGVLDSGFDINQPSTMGGGVNAKTPPQTFAALLGGETACSFAVNLDITCKHTNGSGHIYEYDVHREAAFALEIS